MRVLGGDVGGTGTRLALFEVSGEEIRTLETGDFSSRDYPDLYAIVEKFLGSRKALCERACFGIAGPVKEGRSKVTNLPWVIEAGRLARQLAIDKVFLINDLEAGAWGLASLGSDDLLVLAAGEPDARGNQAILSAGTGLGEAGLYWDGNRHRPFATEGGHADFAPRAAVDFELFRFLHKRYGTVSWERILSGPGLVNLYRFLLEHRKAAEPGWLTLEIRDTDPAAAISEAGMAGRCPVCSEALDLFVGFYGAEAGNLALKMMATGGVYLGGGIAPKIVERLRGPAFLNAFRDKGPMASLLRGMPVRVILNDRTALQGTARYAAFEEWR